MDRRSFLKTIGVGFGGLFFVKKSEASIWNNFNPNLKYSGRWEIVDYVKDHNDPIVKKVIDLMNEEEISKVIPPKYRKQIVYNFFNYRQQKGNHPLSQLGIASWTYAPDYIGGIRVFN